jgi:hypothetical protein
MNVGRYKWRFEGKYELLLLVSARKRITLNLGYLQEDKGRRAVCFVIEVETNK